MGALVRTDAERYLFYTGRSRNSRSLVVIWLTQPGLMATALHRFGHWAFQRSGARGRAGRLLYEVARRPVEILTGIWIAPNTHVGPGLYIAHFGGVMVGADSVIGTNCNLGHDVLIAPGGRGEQAGSPRLGDRVNLTCGARVLGPVTIGDDAMIGVNAVVVKDVPPRAVMAAPPSVMLSGRGSFDYVRYPDDDTDEQRLASARQVGQPAGGESMDPERPGPRAPDAEATESGGYRVTRRPRFGGRTLVER
ncbi:MAG TPA: serine acetyltransferase [Acidimicrobiales bacterium]